MSYLLWVLRCGNELFTGDIDGERVQVFTSELKYTRVPLRVANVSAGLQRSRTVRAHGVGVAA